VGKDDCGAKVGVRKEDNKYKMAEKITIINGNYPPNIEDIRKVFDIKNEKGIIFTYGNKIYNPDSVDIDETFLAHEHVHSLQQAGDIEGWWKKYLNDKDFMLSQEIEAYKLQYKYYCNYNKDRNKRFIFLNSLANILSSNVYGKSISKTEALRKIK
jgi:hypothetical protein